MLRMSRPRRRPTCCQSWQRCRQRSRSCVWSRRRRSRSFVRHSRRCVKRTRSCCDGSKVEPRQYLDELMRVLPYWPRERYLELAPQHWAATRARLGPRGTRGARQSYHGPAARVSTLLTEAYLSIICLAAEAMARASVTFERVTFEILMRRDISSCRASETAAIR